MEKIALPTRNGAVDDHFGHCECYTIFTLDADRRIAGRQTLPAAAVNPTSPPACTPWAST